MVSVNITAVIIIGKEDYECAGYVYLTSLIWHIKITLFADDTCLFVTDSKEIFVLRKLQRGLNSMETWRERWNININYR
jgi:hypothetical protein